MIEDCVVRNRNMYATLRRNELTCKPTSNLGPGVVVDMYERNKKFYIKQDKSKLSISASTKSLQGGES